MLWYDEEEEGRGGFGLWFTTPLHYRLIGCSWDYIPLSANLTIPNDMGLEWEIEFVERNVLLYSNEMLVLNATIHPDCWSWGKGISTVVFPEKTNRDSQFYFPGRLRINRR